MYLPRVAGLITAILAVGLSMLALPGCAPNLGAQPGVVWASTPTPGAEGIPSFRHIFVIMMENEPYDALIGSSKAPYINELARNYAVAGQYYAVTHPSLPNYLALVSGSTQGMTTDCETCSFEAPNLADQLDAHQRTWTAYMEDMPQPCYNEPYADGALARLGQAGYVRKHNPWMYFKSISDNPARCNHVVPLSGFATDLQQNRLSDLVWITPNQQHDMHNGSIEDGDAWLASFVPSILGSPAWQDNSVLFIIWDEGQGDAGCCGVPGGGRTVALVIASQGKRGFESQVAYDHYSVLRTIEDAWQLGYLGQAGAPQTRPMADFF